MRDTTPDPSFATRPRGRWLILWSMVAVRIAMGYQFQSAASASPWLIADFGVDYATIGSFIGFYTLPGILIALPGGYIARHIGDKRLVLAGLALMTAGGAISGIGASMGMVFAGRLVAAGGVVFLFVVMTKWVGDWFEGGERFLAMALFLNGWPVGMALGLVVQPALAEAATWHWIFLTSALLAALGLALTLVISGAPHAGAVGGAVAGGGGLRARAVVLVVVAGLAWSVINAGFIAVISFAPGFLATRGLGAVEAGALVSLNLFAGIAGVMAGGWITARSRYPVTITCVATLVGALATALLVFDTRYTLWLVLSGLVGFIGAGVQAALPMEALSAANRALGLGLFYACWFLGFALLPWAAGWIRDATGLAAAPIYFGAGLIAANAPLLMLFRFLQRRWKHTPGLP